MLIGENNELIHVAICAALGAAGLYGQTALATITGTVSDPAGAVVAKAPILLKNLKNGEVFQSASSETGNYTVSQLPIGDYHLTITCVTS